MTFVATFVIFVPFVAEIFVPSWLIFVATLVIFVPFVAEIFVPSWLIFVANPRDLCDLRG